MKNAKIVLSQRPSSRVALDPWRGGEPTLAELMADPITHLVMRRDGLTPDTVWFVILQACVALRRTDEHVSALVA